MMIAYDGTFDGLLTCLYHLVRFDGEPVTIQRESYLRQTLYEYRTIATSRKKADLCLKAIRNISPAMTAYLYKAWLSEQENIETDILHFLRLAAALRKNPESQLFRSFVANVMSAAKRCGGEAHRFLGLIRFKQVGENAFLADMRPCF